jgi:hypothetical protein
MAVRVPFYSSLRFPLATEGMRRKCAQNSFEGSFWRAFQELKLNGNFLLFPTGDNLGRLISH